MPGCRHRQALMSRPPARAAMVRLLRPQAGRTAQSALCGACSDLYHSLRLPLPTPSHGPDGMGCRLLAAPGACTRPPVIQAGPSCCRCRLLPGLPHLECMQLHAACWGRCREPVSTKRRTVASRATAAVVGERGRGRDASARGGVRQGRRWRILHLSAMNRPLSCLVLSCLAVQPARKAGQRQATLTVMAGRSTKLVR